MLDAQQSTQNRDEGIKRAADNAEMNEHGWQEQALMFLMKFPEKRFQAEDVRSWAYSQGLTTPPNDRAWGAVIRKAKNQGCIRHVGYDAVSNPNAHRTPASVWERVETSVREAS